MYKQYKYILIGILSVMYKYSLIMKHFQKLLSDVLRY